MSIPNSNTRRNAVDLTGQKFGRWTVINYYDKVEYKYENRASTVLRWLCRCECGEEKIVRGQSLKIGRSVSCRCYQREFQRERQTVHGLYNTTEYHAWDHMVQRITNPNCKEYPNYGGRGLTLDPAWLVFENFYRDMGKKPLPNLSIERRDNERGYFPDNCYWATSTAQARNKRTNRWIEWNGRRMVAADWAKEMDVNPHALNERLRTGWSVERAMTTPFTQRADYTSPPVPD